jgi:hypothetical protein
VKRLDIFSPPSPLLCADDAAKRASRGGTLMSDPPAAEEEEESRREKSGVPEAARERMRVLQFERGGKGVSTDLR